MGRMKQKHYGRVISSVSSAKLYCCYAVITVLTAAVIALSVTLSGFRGPLKEQCKLSNLSKEEKAEEKPVISTPGPCNATCPSGWIGFGSKCFYFPEDMRNWTLSQTSCMAQGAHLAQFDSLEELNFLKKHVGDSVCWIGLRRESTQHPWKWTDNTEYNNLIPVRGGANCGFVSSIGISSSSDYVLRGWICSKSKSCTL